MRRITATHLGQSGFRLSLGETAIYMDPYLSDSVEAKEGSAFRRLTSIPVAPSRIKDASAVLISHIHGDHCDLDTLLPISHSSPHCRFLGPREVTDRLVAAGLEPARTVTMNADPVEIGNRILVHPIPAAHKEIEQDAAGYLRFLGYVLSYEGKKLLHTGDSRVHELIVAKLKEMSPIDVAFLPVNECNFYRDKAGIVGNMSIRDAFMFAEEIGARRVVPMHYDMFAPNRAYREEIKIIYDRLQPSFILDFDPGEI